MSVEDEAMMPIATGLLEKLQRMKVLHELVEGPEDCDDIWDEYLGLRAELVATFLPIVNQLARAGLLSLTIGDPGSEYLDEHFGAIEGNAIHAFQYGTIWIEADYPSGATASLDNTIDSPDDDILSDDAFMKELEGM